MTGSLLPDLHTTAHLCLPQLHACVCGLTHTAVYTRLVLCSCHCTRLLFARASVAVLPAVAGCDLCRAVLRAGLDSTCGHAVWFRTWTYASHSSGWFCLYHAFARLRGHAFSSTRVLGLHHVLPNGYALPTFSSFPLHARHTHGLRLPCAPPTTCVLACPAAHTLRCCGLPRFLVRWIVAAQRFCRITRCC